MIHKKEMTSTMKTKTISTKMMNFFAKNFEDINKIKQDIPNELSNVGHTGIKETISKKNEKKIKRIKEYQIWVTTHLKVL